MTVLREVQIKQGAVFREDAAVPEHYGDVAAEYAAAGESVVLMDRGDEGRIELTDRDRLAIVHRMSTNAVDSLAPGEGRATVLTTPIGRIIDRVILHELEEDRTLLRTSAGRAGAVAGYLRRNTFFRDRMQVKDVTADRAQLALYGPAAGAVAGTLVDGMGDLPLHHVIETTFDGLPLLVMALDPLGVPGIGLIIPAAGAESLWRALLEAGEPHGIRPAGLAAGELLRIEAGVPGPAGELHEGYIPLEAGLWSDVSFTKGCYTGQEIIARLESRGRLAKTLVGVTLSAPVPVGSAWSAEGRQQGELTSVARLPGGPWIGLGFVRPGVAGVGQVLAFAGGETATIRLVDEGRRSA